MRLETGGTNPDQPERKQQIEQAKKLLSAFGQYTHRPDSRVVTAAEDTVWLSGISSEVLPSTTEIGREISVTKPYAGSSELKITISTFNEEVLPLLHTRNQGTDYPLATCSVELKAPERHMAASELGPIRQYFGITWWIDNDLTPNCEWEASPYSAEIAGPFEDFINEELGIPFIPNDAELSAEFQGELVDPLSAEQVRSMGEFMEEHFSGERK